MARLEYFLVCEGVSVDRQTNRISLFNVLEQVSVMRFPIPLPQVVAISAWNRETSDEGIEHQMTLRIHAPGVEQPSEYRVNVRLENERHRVMHQMQNIQITQPGELRFEILANGEHKAEHLVTIIEHPN